MNSVSMKLSKDCAGKLVRAAVLAPSPDNNQPWRFGVKDDRLLFYLDPQRALPSDVNSMFDLLGLGAAVENACIAAGGAGYTPRAELTSGAGQATDEGVFPLVATLRLTTGGTADCLEPHLAARCTNRKLYSTQPIEKAVLSRIADAAGDFPQVQLGWVDDRRRIRAFARLVATSDRFRFEYEPSTKSSTGSFASTPTRLSGLAMVWTCAPWNCRPAPGSCCVCSGRGR